MADPLRGWTTGGMLMENPLSLELQRTHGGVDYSLLFGKLEKAVLESANFATCLKVLGDEALWNPLDSEKRIRWARLAQMAGGVDIALNVLGRTVKEDASNLTAWVELVELLDILDRRESLAAYLASAQSILDEESYKKLKDHCIPLSSNAVEADIEKAQAPLGRLRVRNQAISTFMNFFSGREDCFARQWANKREGKCGYVPVRRPMEPSDVEDHLSGRMTYGIYLMKEDATVLVSVIDLDLIPKFRTGNMSKEEKHLVNREATYAATRIREVAAELDSKPLIEFSGGKGYHFWLFFESPASARDARGFLKQIVKPLEKDLTVFSFEIFPKQDSLTGKGFGNLVKLPLGIHRLTGKRSFFIECNDHNTDAQLQFLHKVSKVSSEACLHTGPSAELVSHPRWKEWSTRFPDLALLEERCPPLGQLIAAARSGKALNFREEKVLFQTVGFTDKGKSLVHELLSKTPEYNPHMVDYRLSRLSGKPLGCRKIHSLLDYTGDFCPIEAPTGGYLHPLLHLGQWKDTTRGRSEKVENLADALENLQVAIENVRRFLA
jgi:hypothetical protein